MINRAPSIVPGDDATVYLGVDDLGELAASARSPSGVFLFAAEVAVRSMIRRST